MSQHPHHLHRPIAPAGPDDFARYPLVQKALAHLARHCREDARVPFGADNYGIYLERAALIEDLLVVSPLCREELLAVDILTGRAADSYSPAEMAALPGQFGPEVAAMVAAYARRGSIEGAAQDMPLMACLQAVHEIHSFERAPKTGYAYPAYIDKRLEDARRAEALYAPHGDHSPYRLARRLRCALEDIVAAYAAQNAPATPVAAQQKRPSP